MADYSNSKPSLGSLLPQGAVDSAWSRLEPLLTVRMLKDLHLFGIPLVSFIADPITGKRQAMTDEIIADKIISAVALCETELGMEIFPTQHREKLAFDANEFRSLGYFQLRSRPVSSIEKLTVTPANGLDIYQVPNDWIETAYMHRGQINIIPLNIATAGGVFQPSVSSTSGGSWFLSILGQRPWIPAFWQVDYTTGWVDGKIPRMVNEYIGTVAAMEILSLLAATYRVSSHSLGIDSLSQSISLPGPQLYKGRLEELQLKRTQLVRKLKAMMGLLVFSNNV